MNHRGEVSPIITLGIPAVLLCAGILYLRAHPETIPPQVIQMQQWIVEHAESLKQRCFPSTQQASSKSKRSSSHTKTSKVRAATPAKTAVIAHPERQVTLYLTNGDLVTGELLRETTDDVTLQWEYGEATFKRSEIRQFIKPVPSAANALSSPAPTALANGPPTTNMTQPTVTLYLKNGGVVTGELVHDLPDQIIVRMEGGEVGFQRTELTRVVNNQPAAVGKTITMPWEGQTNQPRWDYQHDVVVKLLKGTVVDAQLVSVTPTDVKLVQTLPGGGQIEQIVKRADIDQLLFKPQHNDHTKTIIEEKLHHLFPDMQWAEEGLFTIISDSPAPTIKDYRQTIRELATDWYLTFFPLVNNRQPQAQRYIVVFDDWVSYINYAATDGIPGWAAVGYFDPQQDVLYCFNMLGDRFSELLYDAFLGQFRKSRDQASAQIKGSRYEEFVEGQMSELIQKLERAHGMVRQIFGELSTEVLRHELTHSLFSTWKLQGIILSKLPEMDTATIEKKRQFLLATDREQKRRLLEELLAQQKRESMPEMQASNSWFVEGLAAYMEPTPVGSLSEGRLYEVQEARRLNQLMGLAGLNTFRIGSFPGLSPHSVLYAYAQSWAFCHFLMHQHTDGFLAFQDRMAREHPEDQGVELSWLAQAVGIDSAKLDAEFLSYLNQLPPAESPRVKQMKLIIDLQEELTALLHRLGG